MCGSLGRGSAYVYVYILICILENQNHIYYIEPSALNRYIYIYILFLGRKKVDNDS